MKTFEPPRTLAMGGDGNGLYPHGDEKGRSLNYPSNNTEIRIIIPPTDSLYAAQIVRRFCIDLMEKRPPFEGME